MDKYLSDGVPRLQRDESILTVVLGITITALDDAITNMTLPTIDHDLNATPAESIWAVNTYQIAVIVSMLSLSFLDALFEHLHIYQ